MPAALSVLLESAGAARVSGGALGGRLGAPDMAADDEGYIGLTFDGVETHLQYDTERDEVVAFTRLLEVDVERAAEIYGMLLGANMFWQGTNGATLSVEPDSGMAFLADRRSLEGHGVRHSRRYRGSTARLRPRCRRGADRALTPRRKRARALDRHSFRARSRSACPRGRRRSCRG